MERSSARWSLLLAAWTISAGYWTGFRFSAPWFDSIASTPWLALPAAILVAAGAGYLHYLMRRLSARFIARRIARDPELDDVRAWVARVFAHNTRAWRSVVTATPAGWGRGARRRIARVAADADRLVQRLNDRFTDPSGGVKAVHGPEEDSITPTEAKSAAAGDVADPLPVAASSSGSGDERGSRA